LLNNKKIKYFIDLGRFNKPLGGLLLAWPCTWGVALAKPELNTLIFYNFLFIFSSFVMRGAGCAWNDIVDKNIDINIERTKNRPIAAKKLTIIDGLVFTIFTSIIGLITLLFLTKEAIIISLISIPLLIIYPLTKRITFFPQIWLGVTFNIGLLIGYATITKSYYSFSILLFYFGAILWTIAYDTIYAIQDYKDDKKNKIKSTATIMNQFSGFFSGILYIMSHTLFIISFKLTNLGLIPIIITVLIGAWQAYLAFKIKTDEPTQAFKGFKTSAICGGILSISIIIDLYL